MLKSHPGKRSADRVAFIILKQPLCRGMRGNMRPPVPTTAETIPLHKGGCREAKVVYEMTGFFFFKVLSVGLLVSLGKDRIPCKHTSVYWGGGW